MRIGWGKINTKNRRLIIILLIFFIAGITVFFMIKMHLGQRYFFRGDRITIHLKIIVDDKEIELDQIDSTCIFEKQKCNVNSQNGTYKTSGGHYGMYKFTLTIPKERLHGYRKDLVLNLNYINANSWYISNSDCVVYLNTDTDYNSLSGSSEVNVQYNGDASQEYKNDIKSIDQVIEINWGL